MGTSVRPVQAKSLTVDEFNEAYHKVGVTPNGAMHNNDPLNRRKRMTLCGRPWHFRNEHGNTYCRECQRVLGKRYTQYVDVSR